MERKNAKAGGCPRAQALHVFPRRLLTAVLINAFVWAGVVRRHHAANKRTRGVRGAVTHPDRRRRAIRRAIKMNKTPRASVRKRLLRVMSPAATSRGHRCVQFSEAAVRCSAPSPARSRVRLEMLRSTPLPFPRNDAVRQFCTDSPVLYSGMPSLFVASEAARGRCPASTMPSTRQTAAATCSLRQQAPATPGAHGVNSIMF